MSNISTSAYLYKIVLTFLIFLHLCLLHAFWNTNMNTVNEYQNESQDLQAAMKFFITCFWCRPNVFLMFVIHRTVLQCVISSDFASHRYWSVVSIFTLVKRWYPSLWWPLQSPKIIICSFLLKTCFGSLLWYLGCVFFFYFCIEDIGVLFWPHCKTLTYYSKVNFFPFVLVFLPLHSLYLDSDSAAIVSELMKMPDGLKRVWYIQSSVYCWLQNFLFKKRVLNVFVRRRTWER